MRQTALLAGILWLGATLAFGASNTGMTKGKVQLKSAGPIAFGPDGTRFAGYFWNTMPLSCEPGPERIRPKPCACRRRD